MEWNFLDADATYVYPSQNSSDGGNINSEQNVSNIADSLTYKAFVIRKGVYYPINGTAQPSDWDTNYKNYYIKEDHPGNSSTFYKRNTDSTWHSGTVYYLQEEPLKVTKGSGNNTINVTIGSAVLEGYQLNFDIIETEGTSQYIIKNYPLSDFTICELGNYLTEYKAIWSQLYTDNWVEKPLPKAVKESIKLPLLHVIVKLLKNATGNVRGDLVERDVTTDPPTVSKLCKGVAWAIATDADLENMTVPYLDLATIRLESDSSVDNLLIHDIQNNEYKYTYIDQSSIIAEGDQTTEEYIQNYVTEALDDLDHISSHSIEQPDGTHVTEETDARIKRVRFQVNNAVGSAILGHPPLPYQYDPKAVAVIRYKYEYNDGYDADGNREVEEYSMSTAYDHSYSIDDIQQRTHISSTTVTNDYIENVVWHHDAIAQSVDSRDQGDGSYQVSSSVINGNGSSKLISRADHDHNGMYVKNFSYGGTNEQAVGPLVVKNLFVNGNISGRRDDFSGGALFLRNMAHGSDPEGWGGVDIQTSANYKYVGATEPANPAEGDTYKDTQTDRYYTRINGNWKEIGYIWDPLTPPVANESYYLSTFHVTGQGDIHDVGYIRTRGNITGPGSTKATISGYKVYGAVWNDYAELFLKDVSTKNYAPGTVICKVRGRDCYTESNADNRELVVGVCSDSYGMLLGGKEGNTLEQNLKEYIPVAVAGRVWANIRKGIYVREGDMLAVSRIDKGCVIPCDRNDLEFGTIVGKALSGNKDGKVLMLVSIM